MVLSYYIQKSIRKQEKLKKNNNYLFKFVSFEKIQQIQNQIFEKNVKLGIDKLSDFIYNRFC